MGIDEAGRGPLAGPVAVGIVSIPDDFVIEEHIDGVADSKQLNPEKREAVYERAMRFVRDGTIVYTVQMSNARDIDRRGIVRCVRDNIWVGTRLLAPEPDTVKIYLDGLLKAPPEFQQETIIHGDALEPVISLASIFAKVERDRFMCELSEDYPLYGFAEHKGYGTPAHQHAIREHGLCDEHRVSYCRFLFAPVQESFLRL